MSGQNEDQFDIGSYARLGWWGAAAIAALLLAVTAIRSDTGTRRLAAAFDRGAPNAAAKEAADREAENRRLTETVRSLAADRERLVARVTLLERNVEDVTGSINRIDDERHAIDKDALALPAGPSFLSSVTAPKTITTFPAARVATAHATARGNAAAPESTGTITDFGVDIGGGRTVESLRDLWASAKATHARLFEGLRPVIAVHDVKPGAAELRLVVGPLSNANAAAKLCASLASTGWTCRTAIFDGQRLALR